MRIISLNGWGGKLLAPLLDYVQLAQPDILCLQEVVHAPASTKDWLTYRDGPHILPQRSQFFRDVAGVLPDHQAIFCPAARGDLWDGEVPVASYWGLATYVRHTFPVIGQVQGFVHKDYSPDGFGDHPRSRNAHGVRVWDPHDNRPVSILHTHGLRDPSGKGDTPERLAQAHRLAALAHALCAKGEALVVCGDFNLLPDSETFATLGELSLTDLVTGRGFTSTRTSHYQKPGTFADYMLVNPAVTVQRFEVVADPEVSDHCPLLLEL